MKFDFDYEKCSNVGLTVKYGRNHNVVFFYDEDEDAAGYSIELYRLGFEELRNGFLELGETEQKYYGEGLVKEDRKPYFKDKNLLATRGGIGVCRFPFEKIKPICTLSMDRHTFYASVDFLPVGQYICILKVEDRSGEIVKSSVPYYFTVSPPSYDR